MKNLLWMLLSAMLLVSLAACAGSAEPAHDTPAVETSVPVVTDAAQAPTPTATLESAEAPTQEPATEPEAPGATALVVYFSWSGNTEAVAMEIQNQTGADIFELVPAEPYTDDYNTLLDIAQEEQRHDARPAILGSIESMDGYDTIYLGFPNWWGDMPMILYSFLDDYDLSGKTIAPFCTSGGSGFSGSLNAIRSMEPEATVLDGLHIGSSSADDPSGAVTGWLNDLGVTEQEA